MATWSVAWYCATHALEFASLSAVEEHVELLKPCLVIAAQRGS